MNPNRYPKICYKMQLKWLNLNKKSSCWARDVKELLKELDYGYAWYYQGVGNKESFLTIFRQRQRLFDIDTQAWRIDTQDMSKLGSYLVSEFYLIEIHTSLYRKAMLQLRAVFF